ncbi:MAG: DUF2752 domain-containing protein [Bacteroidaceae bacterium]|nr:DUF2752 domain-containing protein [Bacteroidaceae bacterium]
MIGATVITVAPFFIHWLNPNIEFEKSICPYMRLFDIPCPGCGLTKSMVCLVDGRILKSLYYHPFGIIIYSVAVIVLFASLFDEWKNTQLSDHILDNHIVLKLFSTSFFIYYFIRLSMLIF